MWRKSGEKTSLATSAVWFAAMMVDATWRSLETGMKPVQANHPLPTSGTPFASHGKLVISGGAPDTVNKVDGRRFTPSLFRHPSQRRLGRASGTAYPFPIRRFKATW